MSDAIMTIIINTLSASFKKIKGRGGGGVTDNEIKKN